MALDPRIALMGRAPEMPDVVDRRARRAQAMALEQEAAEAARQAEAERAAADIIAREGVVNEGTVARVAGAGANKLALQWANEVSQRKLRQQQGGAAEALGLYRGQQSLTERQKREFESQLQPDRVRTGTANADIAQMKSGALAPRGDVASQFAQRAAQVARAQAAEKLDNERRGTMTTIEEFAAANPGMSPAELQEAYSRLGKPEPTPSAARFVQILNDPRSTPQQKDAAKASLESLANYTKSVQRPRVVNVSGGGSGGGSDDISVIADAIIKGEQPPSLTGMYGKTSAIRAALARKGYDLTTAERDYKAVQKHLGTLNGAQQERLRQAVTFTADSVDIIEGLYDEWTKKGFNTRFKALNRGTLALARQAGGEAGKVAQALEGQINDLVSELGTVYKGGNSSTDESLRLAAENLRGEWNEATFKRAVDLIRQNLRIRKNSIYSSAPVGVSPNSPYIPQGQRPMSAPEADFNKKKNDPVGIK